MANSFLKHTIFLLFMCWSFILNGQADTTLSFWSPDVVVTDGSFQARYDSVKTRVVSVYPYALHAQNLLVQYQNEIASLDKNSDIKKFGKKAQQQLKEDFKFIVKEMYVSEGKVLMKLIHRETGHTVRDIIELYRGKAKAGWFQLIGNMFDQNLSAEFDPKIDWIIEMVVRDIESGHIVVAPKAKIITKEDYKKIVKKRKERKKKLKEWQKEKKKKDKEDLKQKEESL